jgi:hypothetical protein
MSMKILLGITALAASVAAASGAPAGTRSPVVAAPGCVAPSAADTVAFGFWRRLMTDQTGTLASQRTTRRLPSGTDVVYVVADSAVCDQVRAAAKAAVVDSLGALDQAVIVRVGDQYRALVSQPAGAHWRVHVILDSLFAFQGTVMM